MSSALDIERETRRATLREVGRFVVGFNFEHPRECPYWDWFHARGAYVNRRRVRGAEPPCTCGFLKLQAEIKEAKR